MGHLTIYPASFEMIGRGKGHAVSRHEHRNFSQRNESTLRLINAALPLADFDLPEGFKIGFWTDDYPKHLMRRYQVNLHASLRQETIQRRRQFIPDFMFDAWQDIGITDYDQTCQEVMIAGQSEPIYPSLFWIGSHKTHKNRERLFEERFKRPSFQFYSELKPHPDKFVSLVDHTKHKYLLDIEGRGYSGRLKILLFSQRPIFLVERPFLEFYGRELLPFVHYIPVRRDLSDLISRFEWAQSQPELCRAIALNALEYAQTHLTRARAVDRFRKTLQSIQRQAWACV